MSNLSSLKPETNAYAVLHHTDSIRPRPDRRVIRIAPQNAHLPYAIPGSCRLPLQLDIESVAMDPETREHGTTYISPKELETALGVPERGQPDPADEPVEESAQGFPWPYGRYYTRHHGETSSILRSTCQVLPKGTPNVLGFRDL